jgi:hypothetical protein
MNGFRVILLIAPDTVMGLLRRGCGPNAAGA